MTIQKLCPTCAQTKPLADFFAPPADGRAGDLRTSKHCKACHEAGLIEYGYGWKGFNGMFKTPEETIA